MTEFRMVRQFNGKLSTSESRAYRVESTALMTEQEAMQLMRDLGSPYQGQKYDDNVLSDYLTNTEAQAAVERALALPRVAHARTRTVTFK